MDDLVFLNENSKIKVIRGIYFLFKDNELVYIGQSEDIYKRVPSHLFSKDFNNWNYIEYVNDDLNTLEAEFILKYRPKHNKSIPMNNTWLSQGICKDKLGIGRVETNRLIRIEEVECIIFNNIKYIKGLLND